MTLKEFEHHALSHYEILYLAALKLTRNPETSKDLVQETYYKAFRSRESFEVGTNCKAWLFRIMMNTNISNYRKKSSRPNKVGFEDVVDFSLYNHVYDVSDFRGRNLSEIDLQFLSADVKEAVGALPASFKSAVELVDLQGFSYQEASEILEIPVGTIMSRLHRGRKLLQGTLEDYRDHFGYWSN